MACLYDKCLSSIEDSNKNGITDEKDDCPQNSIPNKKTVVATILMILAITTIIKI